ncbi:MAG: outer membrane lipoprotein-sorting protein [Anaerotruncus sp.]|nr:outer membrane lipoprotein-sorting protein [Anaerotruncus sp.]
MLKLEDQLWTYTPASDRTILISGHMLRQSVMGSDLSYEDMMEDPRLASLYAATVAGEETLRGPALLGARPGLARRGDRLLQAQDLGRQGALRRPAGGALRQERQAPQDDRGQERRAAGRALGPDADRLQGRAEGGRGHRVRRSSRSSSTPRSPTTSSPRPPCDRPGTGYRPRARLRVVPPCPIGSLPNVRVPPVPDLKSKPGAPPFPYDIGAAVPAAAPAQAVVMDAVQHETARPSRSAESTGTAPSPHRPPAPQRAL